MDALNSKSAALGGDITCNIPLLDGDNDGLHKLIVAEVVLRREILGALGQDLDSLKGVLIGAWGILLRCFTGQDSVCFQIKDETGSDQTIQQEGSLSLFHMALDGQNDLATCLRATAVDDGLLWNGTSENAAPSSLHRSNTGIWVKSRTDSEILSAHASLAGLELSGPAQWKICLRVELAQSPPRLSVDSTGSFVSEGYLKSLAYTFEKILAEAICRPHQKLENLDYSSEFCEQQLQKWNHCSLDPVAQCVNDIVHQQVLRSPHKEAISGWDACFTYSELWQHAHSLAHALVRKGIGPDVVVPICFDKSAWSIVAMLAVIEAGGCFCPLDSGQPASRLTSLFKKLNARVLLCSRNRAESLSSITNDVFPVDYESLSLLPRLNTERVSQAKPSNICYIIFTSGSTGEPKGVVIEHRAFCSGWKAHAPGLAYSRESRVFHYAAPVWDVSIIETLTPLMMGATVCVPSEYDRINDLPGAINKMRASWVALTPTVASFLHPDAVPGLKTLILGGEAMSQELLATWSGIKLVNGYGPAECSIAAASNPDVAVNKEPTRIGHSLGVHCWIVDPNDHNRLLPPGCVGELLVEGPTLARGYLGDSKRTDESFIENPLWASVRKESHRKRRMYKTGDLVRYHTEDGSMYFVGRKDTQVKHHGQRIELGEIEYHLAKCQNVWQGIVLMPKVGILSKKLIAIMSLETLKTSATSTEHGDLRLLQRADKQRYGVDTTAVQDQLSRSLPEYMIPSIWLTVYSLPMLRSGKLDRKAIMGWVQSIDETSYESLISMHDTNDRPANEAEEHVQVAWSHALNLPTNKISLGRSFLSLGGDSISAMMAQNYCRKRGINITVQDILRTKSIRELARLVRKVENRLIHDEKVEENFDLSPIQSLYFDQEIYGEDYFNQSVFLRVSRHIEPSDLIRAINVLVSRHSMLRARFSFVDEDGGWKQRVTNDIVGSYRFCSHHCETENEAIPLVSKSHATMDAVNGPLFAADLFEMQGGNQLLFMTAHHLVIDLVSWRIILDDIEEIILNPSSESEPERILPFQAWCRMQAEHANKLSPGSVLPIGNIPMADPAFWGMKGRANVYGAVECKVFELSAEATSAISVGCHRALRTETVDILLAAMLQSFAQVFHERDPTTIFNEGHGREVWNQEIDLSRTVGWFTAMHPIHVAATDPGNFLEWLMLVKDYRRSVPANGRHYFASRMLTVKGMKRFSHHRFLEMTFNYLGVYQQLEREGALLLPVDDLPAEARAAGGKSDVGHQTTRFALFEISAVIAKGKLRFSFTYNKDMKHQARIAEWIDTCQQILDVMPGNLCKMSYQPTLSDFPLLPLTYDSLRELTQVTLPQLGLKDFSNVEDIYQCSQIQQGLLISTQKDTAHYAVSGIWEVKSNNGEQIQSSRLAESWRKVIHRHASLRTVFIESSSEDDVMFHQLVLRNIDADIVKITCAIGEDPVQLLQSRQTMVHDNRSPAHKFTICEGSDGRIMFRLEISHTIMDGTSLSKIFEELELIYDERLTSPIGPLYSSYIAFLRSQSSQAGIGYWKSFLAGIEPCNFPTLTDGVSDRRELHSTRLRFNELIQLKAFCDSRGVTLSNAFHTAWALTLHYYTGSSKVCYGYLTSVRDCPVEDIDGIVGYLVNMLVCRVPVNPQMTLLGIISQVQKDYTDSLAYRNTALSEILHTLKLSGPSLFNTSLSYRKLPPRSVVDKGAIYFQESVPYYDPTEYSVSINIEAAENTAAIDLDYWTDCLSDGQAANVAGTFLQALTNIINCAESRLEQLDSIGEVGLKQIMSWNAFIPPTIQRCVHDIIQEQARARPDAQAICGWDGTFSYRMLDELSSRLSGFLFQQGVGPGSFVALCFEKSAFTIISMLGVLKTGGAFFCLDPSHPSSAHQIRLQDTHSSVVLASPSNAHLFSPMSLKTITISPHFLESLPSKNTKNPLSRPQDPCWVIYTSGSTGKPKGVIIEHQTYATSAQAHGTPAKFGPDSRNLQFSSYTFDNCMEDIFTTLIFGGTVCVPSDHERLYDLAGAISRLGANFADITPTVATYLNPRDVPSLKGMVVGGEALTRQVLEIWGGKVELHNMYGPSECSVNSTHNGPLNSLSDPGSIGRAIGSVSWIVDPENHDKLVPVGCEGELLLEGPILARGYLNDKDKTAKAFIENPKWTASISNPPENAQYARRMYKTGDLVRYYSNGEIAYIGRKDQQVKLNGQRIELGEIEHHVRLRVPSEWRFAVDLIAPGSAQASKVLALFVCPESESNVPAAIHGQAIQSVSATLRETFLGLEAGLRAALPAHMVPSLYVPLASLPLSSSGKLDRRRLQSVATVMSEDQIKSFRLASSSGRTPSTDLEKAMADVWESVLGLSPGSIGMEANFFRAGGDSIAAIRLIAAARSKGYHLTVAGIFRDATLSQMCEGASAIAAEKLNKSGPVPFSLLPNGLSRQQIIDEAARQCQVESSTIEDIYPCTAMQEGLTSLSMKQPGAYVAQNIYRLSGIDIENFKASWELVIAAENILRTRVVFIDSVGFLQAVTKPLTVWHERKTLREAAQIQKSIPRHNGAALMDFSLVREDSGDVLFVWTLHHALYDGWSFPLVLKKVQESYAQSGRNLQGAIDVTPAFPKFVQYTLETDIAQSEEFWKAKLEGSESPKFPALPAFGYQPAPNKTMLHAVSFPGSHHSAITVPSIIRAAWALSISTYSNAEDVIFAETVSGRDAPVDGIGDMIGPAIATIPTRVRIDGSSSVVDFLRKVQQQSIDTLPHQQMGLQRIKRIGPEIATACDVQNLITIEVDSCSASEEFWKQEYQEDSNKDFLTYGLFVSFSIGLNGAQLNTHYDPEMISQWQLERLFSHFECVLSQLNSEDLADRKLSELALLAANDKALIRAWNNAPVVPMERCIHKLVQEKADELPIGSPAICAWDSHFTYRELEQAATTFGTYLQQMGLQRGSRVPICLEKSSLVVIAMLGVLKLGAAFVAVDPKSPKARLQVILEDLEASHIICSTELQELCDSLGPKPVIISHEILVENSDAPGSLTFSDSRATAYLVFTSGSTGKPKGTIVSHTSFVTGALAHGSAMGIGPRSRVLQFSSLVFDVSILDMFTTLILGGCVCIPDEKSRIEDPAKVINDMGVNWAFIVPSFAELIHPADVPGLETLALGGEAVSQNHVSLWADKTHLINAYGPSECSVLATVNSHIIPGSLPSNIGSAVGSHCFIVDQKNHKRLTPIGAVGELVVTGPILARGYLKNQEKTDQAFVPSPSWIEGIHHPESVLEPRIYKTGDLVKYAPDGSIIYIGRKDSQTKLHGQRLELSEVEHHLKLEPQLQHAIAIVPKSGRCQKRLVAVLSTRTDTNAYGNQGDPEAVTGSAASEIVGPVRDLLKDRLPAYMVPTLWIVVKEMPRLPSRKLDRGRVTAWIESLNDTLYLQILQDGKVATVAPATELERNLQQIFAEVLHLPAESVYMDKNFMQLGGDSISAMQVLSRSRAKGLGISVHDILQSRSIPHLASKVTLPKVASFPKEEVEKPFGLSPIQRLYFQWVGTNINHFNQSVVVRLARRQDPFKIASALTAVVNAHSMLRANFQVDGVEGWKQSISRGHLASFKFNHHAETKSQSDMQLAIEKSQQSLDITMGPLFVADLFERDEGDQQILSLIIHHLAVDVVSWGIILDDIESLLTSRTLGAAPSLSFQCWCQLQEERTQADLAKALPLDGKVPAADLGYWGMSEQPNLTKDSQTIDFELDERATAQLLGPCLEPLQMELTDIFIGSILYSLSRACPGRKTSPALFNEAHGRQPWDSSIDLSRTVGWFTTFSPVYLPEEAVDDGDLIKTIRWVKDQKSRVKDKGRPYFAYRTLTEQGRALYNSHWPMEIAFNYLGQEKQVFRPGSLLQPINGMSTQFDISPEVPRLALFEISARVSEAKLKVSFSYNRLMKHQHSIRICVSELRKALQASAEGLPKSTPSAVKELLDSIPSSIEDLPEPIPQSSAQSNPLPELAMSNYPLLPVTYGSLSRLQDRLSTLHVTSADIEDIYPSPPVQQGILLHHLKDETGYMYQIIFSTQLKDPSAPVDGSQIALAWQKVVQKHACLRTVFVDSISGEGLMDQIILKKVNVNVLRIVGTRNPVELLNERESLSFARTEIPHRMTIVESTNGSVTCKLEMSHAICDGTSVPIILNDLVSYYGKVDGHVKNGPLYSDYVAWTQQVSQQKDLEYWRGYLKGAEPCHFPSLIDRSKGKRTIRTHELHLMNMAQLQSFCSEYGFTLSNVMQLAWLLVLRVYTGSDDVCFGYLSSGRDIPVSGVQDAVGLFVSLLICRAELSDDQLVNTVLRQIQMQYAQSASHQVYSLGELQNELQLPGESLFNTAYSFQKRSTPQALQYEGLTYNVLEASDTNEYSMSINIEAYASHADVLFNYWTDFLSEEQVVHISDSFEQILDSITRSRDENQTIGEIEVCGKRGKSQIMQWIDQPLLKIDECIHDTIIRKASTLPPDTPAVCSWDVDLTYHQLMQEAGRLAKHLKALGVGPETNVAMCFEKTSWAVVAMLAILMADGAFVALDPAHPESRRNFIMESVGAKLILCSEMYEYRFSEMPSVATFVVGSVMRPPSKAFVQTDASKAKPSNTAYYIFTSGTTGLPKGTTIPHYAVSTSAAQHGPGLLINSSSRVLQFSSLVFDGCIMEILTVLTLGACICMPSDEERMNDLPSAINRMAVNWIFLTPSVLSVLRPESVPTVRVIAVGGEALFPGLITKWSGKSCLINVYGPTECTVIITGGFKLDETGKVINEDTANIGPTLGPRCLVVNPRDHNKLVPLGGLGELVVDGNNVSSGYLNNPEKTKTAFVGRPVWMPHSVEEFVEGHPKRMYKSGDLVRWNLDGSFSFVSRKDTQIKLNGLRIELGEIEHHVENALPSEVASAVEMVSIQGTRKALAVFLAPSREVSSAEAVVVAMSDEVRRLSESIKPSLSGSLPTYMIPSLCFPVSQMPWSITGKLDRQKLRSMAAAKLSAKDSHKYGIEASGGKKAELNNETEMEKRLRQVWEASLSLEPGSVSTSDSFFARGGDSFQAMKLVSAARAARILVTVPDIFRSPKLSEMAAVCRHIEAEGHGPIKPFSLLPSGEVLDELLDEIVAQCQVEKDQVVDAYSCTPLQEGLLTLTAKQSGAYVVHNAFRLPENIDMGKFKKAWEKAFAQMEIMRTRILHTSSSRFLQVILRNTAVDWYTADRIEDVSSETVRLPERKGSQLTRLTIVGDGKSSSRFLVWSMHHALYDGWSLPKMLELVEKIYYEDPVLPPIPSYAAFVKYITDFDVQDSAKFWRARFSDLRSFQFPVASLSAKEQCVRSRSMSSTIQTARDSSSSDITIPTIIRASWALLVSAYTGSEDVIFGETLSGRNIPVDGVLDMLGPAMTTIPTRINVVPSSSVFEFLSEVQQQAAGVIHHQHVGLQNIRKLSEEAAIACDFQNLLVIQTREKSTTSRLLQYQENEIDGNFFTYPLILEVSMEDTKIGLEAYYNEFVVSKMMVERLLSQFETVFQRLINSTSSNASLCIKDVDVVSKRDLESITRWNSPSVVGEELCVHDLFSRQVSLRPDSLAVCAWDGNFTYRELSSHAMKLSRRLRDLGVGPDVLVPFCMDKSRWLVVTQMGILMAGGGMVPLDPEHPISRNSEIVKDTRAKVLVCSPGYDERFVQLTEHVIVIDAQRLSEMAAGNRDLALQALPTNTAYVVYTSGSTGKPKGVVIEHGAFCTSSAAYTEATAMKGSPRVFNFASLTFDAGIMEVLSPLTMGACVCIPNNDSRLSDPASAINNFGATWALLTPSVASLIEPATVPSLQVLVCGGEAMTAETIARWSGKLKLVNAYGPTEASIVSVVNDKVSQQKSESNIGRAHRNVRAWLTRPDDHNRLAPVGCIAELVLEGPVLARGYLHNEEKTRAAFVENPTWKESLNAEITGSVERLYKTGDLVKYADDGSILYCGRKDHQIKLRGQRMEPGEIESRLELDASVQHAIVYLPRVGLIKNRLVAILSMKDASSTQKLLSTNGISLIEDTRKKQEAYAQLSRVRDSISDQLPAFMVPSTWILVEAIPLLISGKLDRKQVERWIDNMQETTYVRLTSDEMDTHGDTQMDDTVQRLREVWASVFHKPVDKIDPSLSFIGQGGDSLISMSIISKCRRIGITLSLQEILQSRSLFQLAKKIASKDSLAPSTVGQGTEDRTDEFFDLSPIQELYFLSDQPASGSKNNARFNQSQLLRITRETKTSTLQDVIQTIVRQNSMFRARFSRNGSGRWMQRISRDIPGSYRFTEHHVESARAIVPFVASSQQNLDITDGPILIVDLFNVNGGSQILSMIAHHLVIDIVSWSIVLQQMQDLLTFQVETIEKPFPFQAWCALQKKHTSDRIGPRFDDFLPFEVEKTDLKFWGMENGLEYYADAKQESFELSPTLTRSLLSEANNAFGTNPIEIFLSGLVHSFSRVFRDRPTPAVFNEGHGRETWDPSIDISGTVGWFTTISPVYVPVDTERNDIAQTVRRMKDIYRKVPGKGRDYFAHRFLTSDGRSRYEDHLPMEVLFNYAGNTGQLGSDDSLLQSMEVDGDEAAMRAMADVGPGKRMMALFEVSVRVSNQKVQLSLLFSRHMRNQDGIRQWVNEYRRILEETVTSLSVRRPEPTLSDFPLLPTDYSGLQKHLNETYSEIGISSATEVEDMLVAAPLQEGLLLSQITNPGRYISSMVFRLQRGGGARIDTQMLSQAWQTVVNRHQALRTAFVQSVCKGHAFDQIVLKQVDVGIQFIQCEEPEVQTKLGEVILVEINKTRRPMLPHQFSICTTPSGSCFVKLEINHAVIDGGSVSLIIRDIANAYAYQLPNGPNPLYSEYIRYITSTPTGPAVAFWKTYLEGARRCHIPSLGASEKQRKDENQLKELTIDFNHYSELQNFCKANELTLSNVMLSAWGLVLRQFTGNDDVCFGNLTSGRDVPVEGIQNQVGAFINMLVCRIDYSSPRSLIEIFKRVQSDYLESLPHQHCSLAKIQHELGFAKEPLFNTVASVQNHAPSDDTEEGSSSLKFETISAHDPSEFAVTININTAPSEEIVVLRYWTSEISTIDAKRLSQTYAVVLNSILSSSDRHVSDLNIPGARQGTSASSKPYESTERESNSGNNSMPGKLFHTSDLKNLVSECVREVISQMFKSGELVSHSSDLGKSIKAVDKILDSSGFPSSEITPPVASQRDDTYLRDETRKKLLSLWSTVLHIPHDIIHSDDSFFGLGADSVLAIELAGLARDAGLDLTVANIFLNPTLGEMVESIHGSSRSIQKTLDQVTAADIKAEAPNIEQVQVELYERFSLLKAANVETFIQAYICPKINIFRGGIVDVLPVTDFQALAVAGTLMEARWMMNYFFFDGRGLLDLQRLKRSAFQVVELFDILRTVFVPFGSSFLQVVLRTLHPSFRVCETDMDLSDFTNELQAQDSTKELYPKLGEPYIQFTVVKKAGSDNHRIIMRLSHAQYDGLSMPKIFKALMDGYEGRLLEPSPPFSTYILDAAGGINRGHYDYWRTFLKGSTMTKIIHREQPKYITSDLSNKYLKQDIIIPSGSLKNVTAATVLKAAWALVFAQLSGQSDVVFGNAISGRNAAVPNVENIIGPCLNVIPVRTTIKSGWTAMDLMRNIQGQQVSGMPFESLGFREIVKHCTDWPDWTYFSSVLQHDSFSPDYTMRLGDGEYKCGIQGSHDTLGDISIKSTLKAGGVIEVCLIFADESTIPITFAEKALSKLCYYAGAFARNPHMTLPSPSEISNMKPQTLSDSGKPLARESMAAMLRNLTKHEVYNISETLTQAWRGVLGEIKGTADVVALDSSFYDLGGDLISLAHLTTLLEGEGYNVCLEDLLERPTIGEQIALLSLRKAQASISSASTSTLTLARADFASQEPERAPSTSSQQRRNSFWTRSVSMARKVVARRTRGTRESPYGQLA